MRVVTSEDNVVRVLFPSAGEADEMFGALLRAGLIVRQLGVYGIPQGLRISIGSEDAMRRVADILNAAVRA